MATISRYSARNCWRVEYTLHLPGGSRRRAKYPKAKEEARLLATQLTQLEVATKHGYAARQDVDSWVGKGWLTDDQAAAVFTGYEEVLAHKRRAVISQSTDYDAILAAYANYSLRNGKGGQERVFLKTHRNNLSMAAQVASWLKASAPRLSELTSAQVRDHLDELKRSGYSDWTVWNYFTKLRLLLDQAVELRMVKANPAREIHLTPPRTANERRVLQPDEIALVLTASIQHRELMSGSLPTVVRLGLYAGLRNQEMCWLRWDAIDWRNRIITIRAVTCEETGRNWMPKDSETRRLDVKAACIEYLGGERERQQSEGILGQFVMPGGDSKLVHYRNRPLSEGVPQRVFARMIRAEGMDPAITVYSLRHTYATNALRSGVDVRTLQQRMGHSNIKTTMEYLHYIEPEAHPMDRLPY